MTSHNLIDKVVYVLVCVVVYVALVFDFFLERKQKIRVPDGVGHGVRHGVGHGVPQVLYQPVIRCCRSANDSAMCTMAFNLPVI